jgi:hypothetical protein
MLSSDEYRVSTGFLSICKRQLRAAKQFIAECSRIPTTSLFPNLEVWHTLPAISVNWRHRCLRRRKRLMLVSVCGKNHRGLRSLPLSSRWYLVVFSLESIRILLLCSATFRFVFSSFAPQRNCSLLDFPYSTDY